MKMQIMLAAFVTCAFGTASAQDTYQPPPPPTQPPRTPQQPSKPGAASGSYGGQQSSTAGTAAQGQWPASVEVIKLEKGKAVDIPGQLDKGMMMSDLGLPASCVPQGQLNQFKGNVVLFGAELPKKSDVTITVKPKDPSKHVSVFAYTQPNTTFALPGKLTPTSCRSAVSTEVDMAPAPGAGSSSGMHGGKTNGTGMAATVKINGGDKPQNIVIGIAGAEGTTAADFELSVHTK